MKAVLAFCCAKWRFYWPLVKRGKPELRKKPIISRFQLVFDSVLQGEKR
jgi:hypothetical protein